jgi:hypothetical protein
MSLQKINALREKKATLAAKKESSLRAKNEAEEQLKELGWDGEQPVAEFEKTLSEQAKQAAAEAEEKLAAATALAKEFETA